MRRLSVFLCLLASACFAQSIRPSGGGGGGGSGLPAGGSTGQQIVGPSISATWAYGHGCTANSSGEVNVVDCGADPTDSITSAAQNTAFTNAIATGAKRIIVPDGQYTITGITVPSDGTGQNVAGWEIVGLGQPHIQVVSALNAIGIDIAKQRYAVVKNLWISSTGSKTDGNSTIGIKFEGDSSRTVTEHNRIENFSLAGVQPIQPLVFQANFNVINSNNYGYDLEKFSGAVPTTANIIGGYITSNLRGYYADGQVGGVLDGVAFESNGSSSTNDAAIQLNTGSRGVAIHACYFEANNRNYVFTDSRTTRVGNVYVGTPAGADVITWSGVATTNRVNTEINNDTISGGHFIVDPNAGIDADFTMARSNAASTGTIKYSHSQTTSWRNNANTGDLALGADSSDRLTFASARLITTSSSDTLTNKIYVSSTANPAASGVFRLGNHSVDANEFIGFRNFANSATLGLYVNNSDQLVFNGTVVGAAPSSSSVSLQSSYPGVPDNGNFNISGSGRIGTNLDVLGSATIGGHVGALQFTTAYSSLNDRWLGLNLDSLTPAYTLHTLGQVRHQAIADPSAPTVTNVGTTGATTYSYQVSCHGPYSGVTNLSSAGSTTTGNATLSTSNYNVVSWVIPAGAVSCDVYKGNTTTLLGNVVAPLNSIQDTGQSTSTVTAVARNTTADVIVDGTITATSSALNVPVVAGATAQQLIETGTQALTAGAATVTLATAFSSTPVCTCTDQTAAAAVKCAPTATTLPITGTSTDTIAYVCVGAK